MPAASSQPVQELQLDPNKLKVPDNIECSNMKTSLDSGLVLNNLLVGASPGMPSITSSVLPAIGSPPPNRILPPSFLEDVLDELDDISSAKPDTNNDNNPVNDHFNDEVPSNENNVNTYANKENDDYENNHNSYKDTNELAADDDTETEPVNQDKESNIICQNCDNDDVSHTNDTGNNENDEKISQKSVYLGGSAPSSGRESQTSLTSHIVMVKPTSSDHENHNEANESHNVKKEDPCIESPIKEKVCSILCFL